MSHSDNSELLRQLLDIGRQMAETRALAPLLVYAVDVTLELLSAQHGFLVLINDDGTLDFPVARDRQGNDIQNPEDQISRTILFRVIDEKRFIRTASAITDSDLQDAVSVVTLGLKSVLCVPLISRGTAIGGIYLENRAQDNLFMDEDAEPLLYLAGHAAVCIQNALLNQELEERANQQMLDWTELMENEPMQAQIIQEAVQKERTRILYSFIQDASHQFRTPLAVIKTSVDLLKRKIDLTQFGNYLERITMQVDVIVRLVDSLNLLAKLDATTDRNFTEENLSDVIMDIGEVFEQRAMVKQIRFSYSSTAHSVIIPVMPDHVRQAIGKIVENALAYTEAGGQVSLTMEASETAVHVFIEDNGVGISDEDLPHVTTRFYRSDKAGTTRGLGLGLAIANKIMQIHDGELHIQSKLGQGTRVELIFLKHRGDA